MLAFFSFYHRILLINMKIEYSDNKIIVYNYCYLLNINDVEKLHNDIKKIFLKLIKSYHINLIGYNIVNVYQHNNYGCILEIENLYNDNFNIDIIDLKLIVHQKQDFYLEFNDYLFNEYLKDIIYYNNKYYLNIDKIENIYKYIEFGKIVYNLDFQ